ncbi:MAG: homoserine kinase [Candidatus Omnitrophica bacterium]|nr:homoserine kinase [Candidatus Omnitrophota bacterium]MCM8788318.1 homoserine kinase [Candidatus Omnitrophota bacterium]
MITRKVAVSVPGCIGNIGSGFDCMGLSVNLFNRFTFEVSDGFSISVSGPGIETSTKNLCFRSFKKACDMLGVEIGGIKIKIVASIPPGVGLGSSGTAVLSGIVAAFILSTHKIEPSTILKIGKDLEGHLDNLAASLLGGLVVVAEQAGEPVWKRFSISSRISAVFFISNEPFPTREARSILPRKVNLSDAVFNLSRACLLPFSFMEKDEKLLAVAIHDKLHQPYRKHLYPHFEILYKAAMDAGAAGCCISGSGPSVVAFCFKSPDKILNSWLQTARQRKLNGTIKKIRLGGKTTWKVY